jgi:hypothetical protein
VFSVAHWLRETGAREEGARGEAAIYVDAPAGRVYALVTDVTRMGQRSSETIKCEWIDGADLEDVAQANDRTNKSGSRGRSKLTARRFDLTNAASRSPLPPALYITSARVNICLRIYIV